MHPAFRLPLVVFLVLVSAFVLRLVAVWQGDAPEYLPYVLINQPTPSFSLPALPGLEHCLRSEHLKGQVSLLNIFGSWCRACLAEHPFLLALKESNMIPIHGINWHDASTEGAAWLQHYGDPYNRVGTDLDSRVAMDLGVTGAPETFVVDATGVIRFRHIGPLTSQVWQSRLRLLIKRLQHRES
ncbi:Cytochrome c-type biogenesis protein CcmG/DsbE, thiol:disulfide oxidoreductase [invertebrate metagenome]|uniref:Cytochrome c-type biogenesis protein CcmG/DsbE, thiol:disulfide oxidoreductase n=1 Tax=invertebrate metagenome TaxID=1711999 RepID=A0A484H8V2_9ZZZZ